MQEPLPAEGLSLLYADDAVLEIGGIAQTVNTAHGRHHDDVPPSREQLRGGLQPELVQLLVDGQVLLDIGIAHRHVGLGLIIVIVRHEIPDGIVGKELPELPVELGHQRLVVGEHERGLLHLLDHVGYGEGLSRARHAQQGLVPLPVAYAFHQLPDGFGLVARRRER